MSVGMTQWNAENCLSGRASKSSTPTVIKASRIATRIRVVLRTARLLGHGRTGARLSSSKISPVARPDPLGEVLAVEHEKLRRRRALGADPDNLIGLAERKKRHRERSDRQTGIASLQAFHRPDRHAHSHARLVLFENRYADELPLRIDA